MILLGLSLKYYCVQKLANASCVKQSIKKIKLKILFEMNWATKFVKSLKAKFKRKPSMSSALNLNCLESVFEHLSYSDLVNLCSIRNHNIKFSGERVFRRKFGTCLQIGESNIAENLRVCQALGHIMNKITIEFRGCEIENLINFVEKNVASRNVEEVELRYVPSGDQIDEQVYGKIQSFLRRFGERFPNLKHLTIHHQGQPTGYYFMYMPQLPNLLTLHAIGDISFERVFDVLVDVLDWKIEGIPNGILFVK